MNQIHPIYSEQNTKMRSHSIAVLLFVCFAFSSVAAQSYQFGQATWYDSILNG